MKLIHKYITKQILLYMFLSVGVFLFVLVAGKALKDGSELIMIGKSSMSAVLGLLWMLVLYVLSYALPLGLLTAVLLVLGRLSAQREIVAMKAAGLSMYSIAAPIYFIAMITTVLSILINCYYTPLSKRTYKENVANILTANPVEYIKEKTFIDQFPGYVIYVGDKEGNNLKDCWIWELDGGKRVTAFIKAKEGSVEFDREKGDMILSLKDGSGEKRHGLNLEELQDMSMPLISFKQLSMRLPLKKLLADDSKYRKLAGLTVFELLDRRDEYKQKEGPEAYKEQIKTQMQLQRNLALAFSILSIVSIAIPLGIKASRTETYANLAIAIAMAITFYVMLMVINWFSSVPEWRPDLWIWGPNFLFQGLGVYLLIRCNRN